MAFALALSLWVAPAFAGDPDVAMYDAALTSATRVYNDAMQRYNVAVLDRGSMTDPAVAKLEAEKEAARLQVKAAAEALRRARLAAGPRAAPALPAPALPAREAPRAPAPRMLSNVTLTVMGMGLGLAVVGAGRLWRRRPRRMKCPGCQRTLKVPSRGVNARCPKCKTVFSA